MIRFSNISLIRGTKVLLEGADAVLNPGDRIGLIGANGSGKSSLFAVLRGELHTDKGDAEFPPQWRVAHVAQETPALDRPAVEYAIDGEGWFPDLFREFLRNGLARLGADPERWRDAALAGLAEIAATADHLDFARLHWQMFIRMSREAAPRRVAAV